MIPTTFNTQMNKKQSHKIGKEEKMNKMIKYNAVIRGIFVILVMLVGARVGYAQNNPKKARQVKLGKDSEGIQLAKKIITEFTYADKVTWIEGANSNNTTNRPQPTGTPIDTTKYLLIDNMWLPISPSASNTSSIVLIDEDEINFNYLSLDSQKVFPNTAEDFSAHAPLDAKIYVKRSVLKYDSNLYPQYKDSVYRVVDSTFLVVKNGENNESVELQIVINDTVLLDKTNGEFHSGKQFLNDVLQANLGLPKKAVDTAFLKDTTISIRRIQVIPEGRVPSYTKEIHLKVQECVDKDATPLQEQILPQEPTFMEKIQEFVKTMPLWAWGIVVFALLVIVGGICFFCYNSKKSKNNRFKFNLSKYPGSSEIIEKLKTLAQNVNVIIDDEDPDEISFEVNQNNLQQFEVSNNEIEESQKGFYQILKEFIQQPLENCEKNEKKKLEEAQQKANEELKKLENFVSVLKTPKKVKGEETSKEARTNDKQEEQKDIDGKEKQKELEIFKKAFGKLKVFKGKSYDIIDDYIAVLNQYAENWEDVKQRLQTYSIKDSSDVVLLVNRLDDKIDQLNREVSKLKGEVSRLSSDIKMLDQEIGQWKTQTGFDYPKKAGDELIRLNGLIIEIRKENDDLSKIVNRIKETPQSFKKEKKEYKKLVQLIEDAEEAGDIRNKLNDNPDEIESDSTSGKLISKGRVLEKCLDRPEEIFKSEYGDKNLAAQVKKGNFLDKAKNDVRSIRADELNLLGECELRTFVEYIVNPQNVIKTEKWFKSGLYKLVQDVEMMAKKAANGESLEIGEFTSEWLRDKVFVKDNKSGVAGGYNQYIMMKALAAKLGSEEYNTSQLRPEVKEVFDDAERYLKFESYRNYWKNIIIPIFTTLDGLQNHNDDLGVYNTRALMFYVSQFYSIACIMNEIYGDQSYSTKRPKISIALFNSDATPLPSHFGFPVLDDNTLKSCGFEFKGGGGEDKKVAYLKQFKPLPFLFIDSYFNDNLLS